MKKSIALLLAGLLYLGLLSGCDRAPEDPYVPTGAGLTWDDPQETLPGDSLTPTEPEPEQELTLAYHPQEGYNPYTTNDVTNRTWLSLVYQGLFAIDRNYEAFPILCDSYWVSNDMQTYVFMIRPDAVFSDGTRVRVEDVIASLEYAMQSQRYKGRFGYVTSVTPSTGGGVTVRLSTAYENFPLLLDIPILKKSELTAQNPLGTGPYRIGTGASGLRLLRVENWWAGAELPISASAITLRPYQSASAIRDDFERDILDLVCTDPGARDYAPYRADCELFDSENGEFLYITVCNESWLYEDEDVRKAFTHAINRDALSEKYYDGFARSASLAASPLSPYYDALLASRYAYEPQLFQSAIDKNGHRGREVRIMVNSGDARRVRMAQDIGKMLEGYGLTVKMELWTGIEYDFLLAIDDFDIFVGQTRLSPNMDLTGFFSADGKMTYGNLDDVNIYSLCLDSLANAGNHAKLLQEASKDCQLIPVLFGSNTVYARRGMVSQLSPARDNVFYYDLGKTSQEVQLAVEPLHIPTEPPTDPEPTDPEPTDPEPTDPEPTDPEPTE